ncbi:MAG: RNA polymerase sigma factor [Bacteroidetes bacterium]|nr:RNA polymerase sigma factor [Bacteroidota bacterium]
MLVSKEVCDKLSDNEIIKISFEQVDYFSCLYDRYGMRLLRYIKKIAVISEEEAEDILQESFIKVWRNLHSFDQSLKLSSWLYRIVHNETISYWRKQKSFGKDQKVEWDETLYENIPVELEKEDWIEQKKVSTHRILNHLPLKYKEVLILKYFEGMSYEEISDVLKIPEGTVATRMNRAKKAFIRINSIQYETPKQGS